MKARSLAKGIYDVDAFELALNGRFPENRILSHDLLEGCYARAGLLSDVQLYEEYPSRYSADVSRRHRWIRGDWQIARWLLPRVPGFVPMRAFRRIRSRDCPNGRSSTTFGAVSCPSALTLLLLLGWTVLSSPWFWTLSVIGIILIPSLITSILDVLQKPDEVLLESAPRCRVRSAGRHFAQAAFTLACLPYEAFFSLDAIVRTIVADAGHSQATSRMESVGRPGAVTAARASFSILPDDVDCSHYCHCRGDLSDAFEVARSCMWPCQYWAFGLSPLLLRGGSAGRSPAAEQGCLLTRPSFSGRFPAKPGRSSRHSSARKIIGCRLITIRSIPLPGSAIARRRPTWDLRCWQICPRTTSVTFRPDSSSSALRMHFKTMETMERHRGHFYNWYDTQSLKPLHPMYISTVDSGNLAAHLLTLRPGLLALSDQKILGARFFDGLGDTLKDPHGRCERIYSGPTCSTSERSGVCVIFPADNARQRRGCI